MTEVGERMDRATRDEVIRIARERGVPFRVIAERVGLSESRCRQIVRDAERVGAPPAVKPPVEFDEFIEFREGMPPARYAAGLAWMRSWHFGPHWLRPSSPDEPHLEAPALDESVPRRERIRALREEREIRFGKARVVTRSADGREVVVPSGGGAAYNERMREIDRQLRHLELLEAWPVVSGETAGETAGVLDEVSVPFARPRDGLD